MSALLTMEDVTTLVKTPEDLTSVPVYLLMCWQQIICHV